jgi:hypothetical protein
VMRARDVALTLLSCARSIYHHVQYTQNSVIAL